jgi:hypothetical protein
MLPHLENGCQLQLVQSDEHSHNTMWIIGDNLAATCNICGSGWVHELAGGTDSAQPAEIKFQKAAATRGREILAWNASECYSPAASGSPAADDHSLTDWCMGSSHQDSGRPCQSLAAGSRQQQTAGPSGEQCRTITGLFLLLQPPASVLRAPSALQPRQL